MFVFNSLLYLFINIYSYTKFELNSNISCELNLLVYFSLSTILAIFLLLFQIFCFYYMFSKSVYFLVRCCTFSYSIYISISYKLIIFFDVFELVSCFLGFNLLVKFFIGSHFSDCQFFFNCSVSSTGMDIFGRGGGVLFNFSQTEIVIFVCLYLCGSTLEECLRYNSFFVQTLIILCILCILHIFSFTLSF